MNILYKNSKENIKSNYLDFWGIFIIFYLFEGGKARSSADSPPQMPAWPGLKLGARTQSRSLLWLVGTLLCELSLLPPKAMFTGSWSQEPEPKTEPRHSMGDPDGIPDS